MSTNNFLTSCQLALNSSDVFFAFSCDLRFQRPRFVFVICITSPSSFWFGHTLFRMPYMHVFVFCTCSAQMNMFHMDLDIHSLLLLNRVCLLVGCLTSQQQDSVFQGRIYSDNYTCCHTEIQVADKLSTSPSHSILTPGRPVPAQTLSRRAPGGAATGVPIFKSLV